MAGRKIDLTGKRFGNWTVMGRLAASTWNVRCTCGHETAVQGSSLTLGKSTGCKACAGRKHGMEGSKVYNVWAGMKQRCQNPDYHSFDRYGGRGITVCERWQKFEHFYEDMGDPPEGASIDRIDNSKGYEPANCRWTTPKAQQANRRVTTMLKYRGKQFPLTELSERFGVERHTLRARLKRGWSVEDALEKPVQDMSQPRK